MNEGVASARARRRVRPRLDAGGRQPALGLRTVLAGAGLLVLAVLASQRVDVFASDLALWADAARLSSPSPRAVVNHAAELGRVGRYVAACAELHRAEALLRGATTLSDRERQVHERAIAINEAAACR